MLASNVVRFLAIVATGLGLAMGVADADPRADLQAKGELDAKEGRYGDAIEAFKAADQIERRASHACLIALAYTRRELWPQAELFLSLCHERAKAGDPLPDWVPLADQQIKERLASANVVAVSIEVTPPTSGAKVTVSSFAPDEVFEPRTIYLPLGTHVVFARATGFADAQKTIEIKDKTPQKVVIDLAPPTTQVTPPIETPKPDIPPPAPAARGGSTWLSTGLLITAGVVGVLGVGSHLRMHGKYKTLDEQPTDALYDEHYPAYSDARRNTIVLYVVAAGLGVTGYLLRRNAKTESAQVTAVPLPEGGGFVSVGWTR